MALTRIDPAPTATKTSSAVAALGGVVHEPETLLGARIRSWHPVRV
ncbi:hypothetical protein [Longispora albida]|nr:hypothetical protein [Longispora albida]